MKQLPWDARGLTGFIHRRCGIPECQVQFWTPVVNPDPQGGGCPLRAGHEPIPEHKRRHGHSALGNINTQRRGVTPVRVFVVARKGAPGMLCAGPTPPIALSDA